MQALQPEIVIWSRPSKPIHYSFVLHIATGDLAYTESLIWAIFQNGLNPLIDDYRNLRVVRTPLPLPGNQFFSSRRQLSENVFNERSWYSRRSLATERSDAFSEAAVQRLAMPAGIEEQCFWQAAAPVFAADWLASKRPQITVSSSTAATMRNCWANGGTGIG